MPDTLTFVLAACGLLAVAITLRFIAATLLSPGHPLARAFDLFDDAAAASVSADDHSRHDLLSADPHADPCAGHHDRGA